MASDLLNSQVVYQHIVIVEDDQRLAELTADFLQQNGFKVTLFTNGKVAAENLPNLKPDLMILDLMLPGLDGIELCKQVRRWFNGPVLMLTAKSSAFDQVIGLEVGADDYVVKPADPHVLLARVRALLRRMSHSSANSTDTEQALRFGELEIDPSAQRVILNEQTINLTTREFQLLWLLAENAGHIISRDEIFARTRGLDYDGMDRTVDVRISKLRKKLGDDSEQPSRIKTVWGKGYLFVPDAWDA